MADVTLSKDADALICAIYKVYLQRRKDGASKADARLLGGSDSIQEKIIPKWSFSDVDETCRELGRAGMLDCFYADDVVYIANLSDAGIIYMEQRFKNGLTDVLNYPEKIKSILLW